MAQRIVGHYGNEQDAINAINDLKARGYDTSDISVISKNKSDVETVNEQTGTKAEEGAVTGMATGGILGGVGGVLAGLGALAIPGIGPVVAAGPILAGLTGAAAGAAAGGLAGALIGLGIPEEEARQYDNYFNEGEIIVLADDKGNNGTLRSTGATIVSDDRRDLGTTGVPVDNRNVGTTTTRTTVVSTDKRDLNGPNDTTIVSNKPL